MFFFFQNEQIKGELRSINIELIFLYIWSAVSPTDKNDNWCCLHL